MVDDEKDFAGINEKIDAHTETEIISKQNVKNSK